jgi:hypothetical protein
MRLVPINEAEAIIEPLWDGGSSDHRTDKYPFLSEYEVTTHEKAKASVSQAWCGVQISIARAPVSDSGEEAAPAVQLERTCEIDISDYDIFRVFASIPEWVTLQVDARIDGHWQMLCEPRPGTSDTGEIDMPLSGRMLEQIRLSFALSRDQSTNVLLEWFGLSNRSRQQRMEAQSSPYDAGWKNLIADSGQNDAPEIGLYFDAEGLGRLREIIRSEPYATAFSRMRDAAEKALDIDPESLIGEYVPWADRRWCRDRDMDRPKIFQEMVILAFVGLVERREDMRRMAVRMALSIAHCGRWTESIMGCFPGATWHHRSFTEGSYLEACALVLDWAGSLLTSGGRHVVLDAMAIKGLPRLESDFMRIEYIRHMNQGIHFNSGRIHALLALAHYNPRYSARLSEAADDLIEMVDNYVLPDGGTLEGPGYWHYTFHSALQEFYLLARYFGKSLKEYASPALRKTGRYALAMHSLEGEGTQIIPVNDCHPGAGYQMGLVAAFCLLSDDTEWKRNYAVLLKRAEAQPDFFWLTIAPEVTDLPQRDLEPPERFEALFDTGQVQCRRELSGVGMVNLHYATGPVYAGHAHADKGSVVLEIVDEAILIERGSAVYSNPETAMMKLSDHHSMAVPFDDDGESYSQPMVEGFGGTLEHASFDGDGLHIRSNDTGAWEEGLYAHATRELVSENPSEYLLTDTGTFARSVGGVAILFHTLSPVVADGDGFLIKAERATVRIYPENWTPVSASCVTASVDGELRPVNVIRFATGPVEEYTLTTRIEVLQ